MFFIGDLSCCLGFFWVVLCYHIFCFQQMKMLDSGGKSEIFLPSMLWVAYFLICTSPSKSKNCRKEMAITDWNLIPNRIISVVAFIVGSYLLIKYKPIVGRISEKDVLFAYWKTFVTGLWILMLSTIISIRVVFRMKLYPSVAQAHNFNNQAQIKRIVIISVFIALTLLFIILTGFNVNLFQLPNFIYR